MLPRRSFLPKLQRLPQWAIALMVILAVMGAAYPRSKVQPLSVFDQSFYLGIASDLLNEGRFTNGYVFQTTPAGLPRPAGMRFAPLYPSILAVAASLDPPFARGMSCLVQSRGRDASCPRDAVMVRSLQYAMLTWFYLLVWWIVRQITNTSRTAWLGLGLSLLTMPDMLNYANILMTEVTALTFVTSATAATIRGLDGRGGRAGWLALAGASAGLASLTRPAYLYLLLVCSVAGVLLALMHPIRRRRTRLAAAFALSGFAVVAPWIARNTLVLGDPALTAGYGPQVLVQRIAFDQMSWAEYRLSFLCWLPDGNGMGELLFGPATCHRYQWADRPDNFYAIGNGPLMQSALVAAGGWPHMLPYLIHTYILPHPLKYSLVTVSLALRGAWISHYWGFVLMPLCVAFTWQAIRRHNHRFLVTSLPAWFMLLFTAAVSVNQTRYNLTLIPPFALSGAIALESILRWQQGRERPAS